MIQCQQHFLLSAKTSSLSIKYLHRISNGDVFVLFREL